MAARALGRRGRAGRHRNGRRDRRRADRLGARRPRSHRHGDGCGDRRRPDGVRPADARRRDPAHPVLAPCRPAGPRRCAGDPAQGSGPAGRQHARQAFARLPLPLSRRSAGRDRDGRAAGPGAGVPLHADQAGGELWRRGHAAQCRGQGRAEDRRGRRREPPHGLRSAPHEPQSVSRAVRQPRARGRGDPAAGRQLRHRLRQRRPPRAPAAFTFRFWVNDTQPPSLRLAQARVRRNVPLVVRAEDLGSGIDATTIKATIDGRPCSTTLVTGTLRIRTTGVKPGKHKLRLQASDYQESRNMENVPPILPNTRVLSAAIVIR